MAAQQPVQEALQHFVISCTTNKPLTQKIKALFPPVSETSELLEKMGVGFRGLYY